MKTISIRIATVGVLVASAGLAIGAAPANATVTYSTKGTAQLYDIVEAAYVLNDSRIAVLSNDTSNAVLQLVNPTTRTVTNTLAFTAPNADGSNAWDTATDMEITPNGQTAFITFAGGNYALAKINLSSFTVADYVSLSGANAIYANGAPEFAALREGGAAIELFSRANTKVFSTNTLDRTGVEFSVGPEVGVTNRSFVSDPLASVTIWADITDDSMSGNSRVLFFPTGRTLNASTFGIASIASAITLNHANDEVYVGTKSGDVTYLARMAGYIGTDDFSYGGANLSLEASFDGVRQVAASADGSQFVALSTNGRIARVPLGRGWNSSLVEYYSVVDAGVTLGSAAAIAIASDGSQVTYLDSRAGSNDNIINFALANNAAVAPTAPTDVFWYANSAKNARFAWAEPADNGGAPVTKYIVQCTNGTTATYRTIKTLGASANGIKIVRNLRNSINCRVLARNSVGTGVPSEVVTITKKGGPTPSP